MKRNDIDSKYKWKLEDLYADDELWESDFRELSDGVSGIEKLKGTASASAESLLNLLESYGRFSKKFEKLFVYARMRLDEDNGNAKYQDMAARSEFLLADFSARTSFIEPELSSISEEKINKFMNDNEALRLYEFDFKERIRRKKYVLSEKEERILALAAETCNASADAFRKFNNADIKFPCIKNEQGEKVQLTHGSYALFLDSKDRNVRKNAFKGIYSAYRAYQNTLASMYSGQVKSDCFVSSSRGYESCLVASLDDDNIDADVYNNLIEVVNKNIPALTKYLKLRKKALGVRSLHLYDLYTPVVELPEKKYSFEEGWALVKEAIKPMGEEYCNIASRAFEEGWIDVYETEGKTTGAYAWGCYGNHPYILLNWQGTFDDVFTLAHELGHAMHTYYSNLSQPYIYAGYKIFVAEVASTVNENLLVEYLMNNTDDEKEKAYILNHYLEAFRLTIIRQTMFAEFERDVHAMAEKGQPLTCKVLCDTYYGLNVKYFGAAANVDRDIELEWSRIPHFYTPFYVYKYATGFSAAVVLAGNILSGNSEKREKYIDFLKSGGSDYPLEILKKAGVDLTSSEPVERAMKLFSEKIDQLGKYM